MTGSEYAELIKRSPYDGRRAIFDEYYNYVYTIVCGRLRGCGSHEDFEECVSDVFAEVFSALGDGERYSGELKSFIGTIAKRRAVDRYRSISSEIRHFAMTNADDDELDRLSSDISVEEETERTQLQGLILDEIERLGEPDSSIIIRKYYYGQNSRQIAEALSMKTSAVRMRCSRALKKLKKGLENLGIEEADRG